MAEVRVNKEQSLATGKLPIPARLDDVIGAANEREVYGTIAPLLHGLTNLIHEGDFDVDPWCSVLEKERVTFCRPRIAVAC